MEYYDDVPRKPKQLEVVEADPDSYELFSVMEPESAVSPHEMVFRPLGSVATEHMPPLDARRAAANDDLDIDEDPLSVAS